MVKPIPRDPQVTLFVGIGFIPCVENDSNYLCATLVTAGAFIDTVACSSLSIIRRRQVYNIPRCSVFSKHLQAKNRWAKLQRLPATLLTHSYEPGCVPVIVSWESAHGAGAGGKLWYAAHATMDAVDKALLPPPTGTDTPLALKKENLIMASSRCPYRP